MEHDLNDIAAQLARDDPDRFRTLMLAHMPERALLLRLYGLNLEIARAAHASPEPMLCQMRLQWWADQIADGKGLAAPLLDAGLPRETLAQMVEARRMLVGHAPIEDLSGFLEGSAAGLMALGARILGAADEDAPRRMGWGAGAAALINALPQLGKARITEDLPQLARTAQRKRAEARVLGVPRKAVPALLAGWDADAILADTLRRGAQVAEHPFAPAPLKSTITLWKRYVLGRP